MPNPIVLHMSSLAQHDSTDANHVRAAPLALHRPVCLQAHASGHRRCNSAGAPLSTLDTAGPMPAGHWWSVARHLSKYGRAPPDGLKQRTKCHDACAMPIRPFAHHHHPYPATVAFFSTFRIIFLSQGADSNTPLPASSVHLHPGYKLTRTPMQRLAICVLR